MKLLAILLIGWLALAEVEANSKLTFWKKGNFSQLNDYLVDTLPDKDDLETNLAHIESNIDQWEGALKVAGQVVLDINKIGDECSSHALSVLLKLRTIDRVSFVGKRLWKLTKDSWTKTTKICIDYVQQHYRDASAGMAEFLHVFQPRVTTWRAVYSYEIPDSRRLYTILKRLARNNTETAFIIWKTNEKTGKSSATKDRAKFEHAFEELFVKPCQSVVSDEDLLKNVNAFALGNYKGWPIAYNFDSILSKMNWNRRICNKIVGMDYSARTGVFASWPNRLVAGLIPGVSV